MPRMVNTGASCAQIKSVARSEALPSTTSRTGALSSARPTHLLDGFILNASTRCSRGAREPCWTERKGFSQSARQSVDALIEGAHPVLPLQIIAMRSLQRKSKHHYGRPLAVPVVTFPYLPLGVYAHAQGAADGGIADPF